MARAKQFASRIAKSLDQKGVIMRSSIRMAQPCCSLTTLNVIIAYHREWAASNYATSICERTIETADDIQQHGEAAALIYVKRCPVAPVPEIKEKNLPRRANRPASSARMAMDPTRQPIETLDHSMLRSRDLAGC
jgi:hypothetical protein